MIRAKLDTEPSNVISIFYCPLCKGGGNLQVDSEDAYFNSKPYNYRCWKCKNRFKIKILKSLITQTTKGNAK